jgi:hypothetical protein
MNSPSPLRGDKARVTVHVAVDPAVAFEVFTEETDLWWRRGPRYRMAGKSPGALQFEPGLGGRLFERVDAPSGPRIVEIGKVKVWEPPARLVFEWRNINFAPDEKTEVEVLFERTPGGTRVTVEHRGWTAIRPDHPARHGMEVAAFLRSLGIWWGDQMTALREHVHQDRA